MVLSLIFLSLYVIASHILFRELHQLWSHHLWKDKNKILLYPVDCENVFFKNLKFILCGFYTLVAIFVLNENIFEKICIFILYIIHNFICTPDKNDILEINNLNIGYGAALWYYNNYLTLFFPHVFIERVKLFEAYNKVDVLKKLFILIPESCVIQKYLDNDETDCIERCHELPKYQKSNSGIKDRTYNLTVYLVRKDSTTEGIRMAVEYAQPLKGLFGFKAKKIITEAEMLNQRKIFVKCLWNFLQDENDSYKFCELVEYNDKERNVSGVLMDHPHFFHVVMGT